MMEAASTTTSGTEESTSAVPIEDSNNNNDSNENADVPSSSSRTTGDNNNNSTDNKDNNTGSNKNDVNRKPKKRNRRQQLKRKKERRQKQQDPKESISNETSNNETKEEDTVGPPWLRKNTPGRNTYLKVVLNDETYQFLHNMTLRIQHQVEIMQADFQREQQQQQDEQQEQEENEAQHASLQPPDQSLSSNDNNRDEAIATKLNDNDAAAKKSVAHKNDKDAPQKQGGKNKFNDASLLRIKPRSKQSLHMTFFFGGEVICELPESELRQWYNDVKDCLARVHFRPMTTSSTTTDDIPADEKQQQVESNKVDENDNDNDGETPFFPTQLKLQKICVFPPRRNNLIVAVLEVPSEWNELYQNIYKLALDNTYDSIGLREIVKTKGKTGKWIAHITLANIFTPRGGGTNKKKLHKDFIRSRLTPYLDSLLLQETTIATNDAGNDEKKQECEENDSMTTTSFSTGSVVTVKSISLGGPQPRQIQGLDWDFVYQGANKPNDGS